MVDTHNSLTLSKRVTLERCQWDACVEGLRSKAELTLPHSVTVPGLAYRNTRSVGSRAMHGKLKSMPREAQTPRAT